MITRILTAVVLIFACSTLMAQSKMYQPVRVDVTLSAPLPMGGTGGYGIGGCIDAKYNLLDQLAVGLRIEGAAMMGGSIADTGKIDIGVTAVTAYLVKGEYYFTKGSNVRPFGGLALGLYSFGSESVATSSTSAGVAIQEGTLFGVAPQLGINLGAFRIDAMYHIIMGESQVNFSYGATKKITRNFLEIELGFGIGGGLKK